MFRRKPPDYATVGWVFNVRDGILRERKGKTVSTTGIAGGTYSSLFDKYFRLFSGHTQVNATDIRKMRYPSHEQLIRLGAHIKHRMPDQEAVDAILECEIIGTGPFL